MKIKSLTSLVVAIATALTINNSIMADDPSTGTLTVENLTGANITLMDGLAPYTQWTIPPETMPITQPHISFVEWTDPCGANVYAGITIPNGSNVVFRVFNSPVYENETNLISCQDYRLFFKQ